MCFAPAEAPTVAVAVVLENAGHGGAEAAPVAGAWLHDYFVREGLVPAETPGEERP
jgi:penicillin-binding protein 2